MTDTTQTLTCVLIPMKDRQLLLPNVSVAEVVDHATDLAPGNGPDWLAGYLEWRGLRLPVVSYEAANGGDPIHPARGRGRVVVLNTIGAHHQALPFLAVVTQGIPSQTRLEATQIQASGDGSTGPADLMIVDLEGEQVYIPNMEFLEDLGARALQEA